MLRALAQGLLAAVLLLAFVVQQTGMTRLLDACCEDGEDGDDACAEATEPGDCPPSCADCTGCPGPVRVLMSARPPALPPAMTEPIASQPLVVAAGRDPRLRLERPPRA